jgi:hypothetical protein
MRPIRTIGPKDDPFAESSLVDGGASASATASGRGIISGRAFEESDGTVDPGEFELWAGEVEGGCGGSTRASFLPQEIKHRTMMDRNIPTGRDLRISLFELLCCRELFFLFDNEELRFWASARKSIIAVRV